MVIRCKTSDYVKVYNKTYYEKNKGYHTAYWENNKEEICAKRTVPVFCQACNRNVQKRGWLAHVATPKHCSNLLKDKVVKEDTTQCSDE